MLKQFLSPSKGFFPLSLLLLTVSSCVNISKKEAVLRPIDGVKISTVLTCSCSIRALKAEPNRVFFAGSKGTFGYLNTADNSVAYLGHIEHRGQKPDFRALAKGMRNDWLLSAGNPALIYKVNLFGQRKLLYRQNNPGTFFDAMAFWNKEEGLAIGDPVKGCLSLLLTRDAGKTWVPADCNILPSAEKHEAAFAASNSNIAIIGNKTWVVTGGKVSKVYFSPDKGRTWTVYTTPIIHNKMTTGGYSIAFFNEKIGIIVGGDYTAPQNNHANKALTTDGGKTWHLLANNRDPGYKSCVKFVPQSNGQGIVATGKTGISYSPDRGKTWQKLSSKPFYTIDFLNSTTAYAAGKGAIAELTFIRNREE